MKEKMWSILVHLSFNQWCYPLNNYCRMSFDEAFDESFWDYLVDECHKAGVNAIVLDVGDGICYASHPEIAQKGAWTRKKVRKEVKRCKDLGIELIPKLNFATTHSFWQGEYRKMTSSTAYYKMASDLIKEVSELFDSPSYIHLGMDEENAHFAVIHARSHGSVIFRDGEQYWHDLRFLVDCVHDCGSMPWVWHSPLFEKYEEFKQHFDVDEMVFSPYFYHACRKEHWTPITERQIWIDWYKKPEYAGMNIQYIEEDPICADFFKYSIPCAREGYKMIPVGSVCHDLDCNMYELVEYFKNEAPDESVLGFQEAPWVMTLWKHKEAFDKSLKLLKEAKEAFYK